MSAPLFAARGLDKRFGAVVAADNVTVEIAAGETVGIIGANGAGKTTFVNMVTGYLKPDDGVILFRGADITRMPPREVTASASGDHSRSHSFSPICRCATTRSSRLSALNERGQSRPQSCERRRGLHRRTRFLARLGIEGFADRPTLELPQGQRKLLDIALAMVGRSAVLLLDEPTSGISAQEKLPLMDLVMEAVAAESAAVLFVEHDMEVVERYAPRVIAFYEGRIIADGTAGVVLGDADVRRYVVGAELHRRTEGAQA